MSKELADLRKKNVDQLGAELIVARKEQFDLRIKHKTGQLKETNQITLVRKKIAKIKTIMNELQIQDSK
ncbi:50S ribosomal protein L29 [Gammaproteobacteria bacterium]|jgi:large subunit ribosomal protein L29|nr:50S ribosomal protein L29 [Gammaproteobacteria bacterium]MDA9315569.1 50S ribosomal protein L29 [Gammaproteobacteria bacterium]MDA9342610.1 50S ribosomal protein L29 [Gammaproteobacteria bacterium]MDA9356006.1 50S ribosomal protein L29 [Gammaproteobacteria bacterium]MDB2582321.1 50S ribosomal protein L29 [Gammaproteobacteria bacterium]|tara:strand:+ start:97 stop:303 length:207 start_codon:yes stop_codon:yes gene_type:complete